MNGAGLARSWPAFALILTALGCEATRPTTPGVASGRAAPPSVYLAQGGFLRFSDDLAMVVDGVMVRDSASAVALGLRLGSGRLFPRGTLTSEDAAKACGVQRPLAFVQTSRAPVVYSPEVPPTCRPED